MTSLITQACGAPSIGRLLRKEAFDEGRQDLEELAGVIVKTKAVKRG